MAATPIQRYARLTGVLFLLTIVGGGFGEAYVPSTLIVSQDAAATARNIVTHHSMFQLGFAGYLVEAFCDVGLTWLLYILLRPVHRELALLTVLVRMISTTGFAMGEGLYFATSKILGGANYLKSFSPDQLNTLALLFVKMSGVGQQLFSMFYGVGSILLGYLIFRSRFLPAFLGVLFAISGLGFLINTLAALFAPAYASSFLLMPGAVTVLLTTLWLLIKGVDVPKWQEAAARAGHSG